jgi:hypothetical protein
LYNAIKGYYSSTYSSDIDVNLTRYDADSKETTDDAATVKRVYYITVKKLIPSESVSSIMVAKTSTTSTITVEVPSAVMLSSPPMSGKFKIKCTNKNGQIAYTEPIPYNDYPLWI